MSSFLILDHYKDPKRIDALCTNAQCVKCNASLKLQIPAFMSDRFQVGSTCVIDMSNARIKNDDYESDGYALVMRGKKEFDELTEDKTARFIGLSFFGFKAILCLDRKNSQVCQCHASLTDQRQHIGDVVIKIM